MWKICAVILFYMLHVHIPGSNSKPQASVGSDDLLCSLYTKENCNVADIKTLCPNKCKTTNDNALCLLYTKENCNVADIKTLCPNICKTTNDPSQCQVFTQKDCQDPGIKASCPNTCKPAIETTTQSSTTIQPTYTNLDLWNAARDGNLGVVKNILLASAVDVNWQNKNHLGYSALHIASKNNHPAIMRVLIDKGAIKDMRDDSGLTSVFHASNEGHLDALSTLIKSGAKVDIGTDDNYTPLMQSTGKGFYAIVEKLIDAGSDVNLANRWGWTALHDAATFNRIEIAQLLFLKEADAKKEGNDGQTPSDKAHYHGYNQLEKILQGFAGYSGPETSDRIRNVGNIFNKTTLWNAARDGNLASVKAALSQGISPNWKNQKQYGQTSLHIAAQNNHPLIMSELMDSVNGANKDMQDNRGFTPIFTASGRGSKDAVLTLIKYKADVDKGISSGYTPLMQATGKGYFSIVQALIDANADVNKHDKLGHTALSTAAAYNRLTIIVQLLFKNGADPTKRDVDNLTPAFQARNRGYDGLAAIIDGYTSVNSG